MPDRMTRLWRRHPRLCAWLILAAGMVAVFAWSARGLGLSLGQWLGVAATMITLAALCVRVVYWEAPHQGERHDR
jgi:hypothetical protein